MLTKTPFLINSIQIPDPQKDKRWVPDGENMWFFPCVIDLKNHTYGGWWYGTKNSHEALHYHTGIAQGNVLSGEMTLECSGKKYVLKEKDGFLLPPETKHTAELIVGKLGFLFFGIIVGQTIYQDGPEKLDAQTYYNMVENYYKQNQIDISHIS